MSCSYHVETPAVAFCRMCGRALCGVCSTTVAGTVYCPEHAVIAGVPGGSTGAYGAPPYGAGATAYTGASGYTAPPVYSTTPTYTDGPVRPPVQTLPLLAFFLGWIPGVGAIYNGQYIKGLVHVVIFGLLIGILNSNPGPFEPMFGVMLAAFTFYMAFEAYHTAKHRQMGMPIDEWSGLMRIRGGGGRAPVGAIVLIGLGTLFLLDSLGIVGFREVSRFWPVLLIVFGVYLLWARMTGPVAETNYPPYGAPEGGTPYGTPIPPETRQTATEVQQHER